MKKSYLQLISLFSQSTIYIIPFLSNNNNNNNNTKLYS